ncbi:MAG: MBL fold metallo-hydrolase [Ruminococcaceae bacterium]|nr:MBL fold metallo-hydrolase [Oscillospiraceae bacterium]
MIPTIHPIRYATSTLAENLILRGGRTDVYHPISFTIYLLITEDRRILVDAGCETMPGFVMHYHVSPARAVERYGVAAEEITDVIITHAHHDHVEAVGRFPNATVYIQQDEYVKAEAFIPPFMPVVTFESGYIVAEGVRVIRWGGHSTGSCVVQVGEDALIVGDEVYTTACVKQGIPTGASCDPIRSEAFIKEYGRGWRLHYCHDPAIGGM